MRKTFKDLIDSGAELVRQGAEISGWQSIYKCPYCVDVVGTPDKRGHLYWNEKKRLGNCFRCKTTLTYGMPLSLNEICQDYVRFNEGVSQSAPQYSSWNVLSWSIPAEESAEAREYLAKRGVSVELQRLFGLRYTDSPYPAIVLPNGYGDSVNFFQLRRLHLPHKDSLRYINPSSAKPVYGTFLPAQPTAVIMEGPFSVIGGYMPDVLPLGLYGKSPSPNQLAELVNLKGIREYVVCLDGGEAAAALSLADQLLRNVDATVSLMLLKYGRDPSDLSATFRSWYDARTPVSALKVKRLMRELDFKNATQVSQEAWMEFVKRVRLFKS